nr:IclR family transcriptional regulator [Pseudomonas sp.]
MQVPSPLARYHQVLSTVAGHTHGLTLAQLVDIVKLPRSSVHRLATSLCAVGYLHLNADGAYALGPALMDLLRASLAAGKWSEPLKPALHLLASELGETAFFARLSDQRIELIDAVTPGSGDRSYVHPGTGERPVDTCSSSKAILAFAEPDVIRQLFDSSGLANNDENEWTDFNEALRKVARDGYAVCDGEIDEGVFSVACPVPVGHLNGLFSIGVVGPSGRMKKTRLEKIVRVVRSAADVASDILVGSIASEARRPSAD